MITNFKIFENHYFLNESKEFDNKPSTHEAVDLLGLCDRYSDIAEYIKNKFSYITFKGNAVDWTSKECKEAGDSADLDQEMHPWYTDISQYIDSIKPQIITYQEIPKLLNFLLFKNENNFVEKLKSIPKETSTEEIKKIYINLIEEKDKLYSRPERNNVDNDNRIVGIIDSIINNNYDPPVLLYCENKKYCIGGRTRLFACIALKKNPIVKIMK